MAIKVVQGLVGKLGNEQARAQEAQQQAAKTSGLQNPQTTSPQNLQNALQTSEAVITTIRTVRSQSGTGAAKPVKDPAEAKEIAKEVSEKIREGSSDAFMSHDGLNSTKSGAVLLN